MLQISRISASLSRTDTVSNELRLFRAQQRAVGELMIHPDGEPGRRHRLGYAGFCAKLDNDSSFADWFGAILEDADRLAANTAPAVARLQDVQAQLIASIDRLDPKHGRFPQFRLAFGHAGRTLR